MLKKRLNTEERYGLTQDQIRLAENYLKHNKTAGALNPQEAMPLYELYLLGYPLEDIQSRYAQYPMGKVVLTAALNKWTRDRERLAASVGDRIRARIYRSTVEQVEFLTDMISVSTKETGEEVQKYLADPKGSPVPTMRIKSIKDFQQVIDMLATVAESVRSLSTPQEAQRAIPGPIKKIKAIAAATDKTEDQVLLAELADEEP